MFTIQIYDEDARTGEVYYTITGGFLTEEEAHAFIRSILDRRKVDNKPSEKGWYVFENEEREVMISVTPLQTDYELLSNTMERTLADLGVGGKEDVL